VQGEEALECVLMFRKPIDVRSGIRVTPGELSEAELPINQRDCESGWYRTEAREEGLHACGFTALPPLRKLIDGHLQIERRGGTIKLVDFTGPPHR
jgi:hypothetical protein